MINKSRGKLAYTIINTDHEITEDIVAKLEAISDVMNVRVIK